jgi:release factor glutamine methyltransferase
MAVAAVFLLHQARVSEPWTTLRVLNWTQARFTERGVPSPRLDAEVLLGHVLGLSRVGLYTSFDKPLAERELTAYRELIKRRLAGEPVAYLVGQQEFWSLPLAVDEHVLIPRRDTETLVEVALRAARSITPGPIRIADLCTGSGAVALALAKELPDAIVTATDVSAGALAVARGNAERLGLRVTFVEGDLLAALAGAEPFALVVSNPPYVTSAEMKTLAPEVAREPRLALDGGKDGLDVIRRLVAGVRPFLLPGGVLALEHGWEQGEAVRALLAAAGFVEVATTRDLGDRDRVTSGRTPI